MAVPNRCNIVLHVNNGGNGTLAAWSVGFVSYRADVVLQWQNWLISNFSTDSTSLGPWQSSYEKSAKYQVVSLMEKRKKVNRVKSNSAWTVSWKSPIYVECSKAFFFHHWCFLYSGCQSINSLYSKTLLYRRKMSFFRFPSAHLLALFGPSIYGIP